MQEETPETPETVQANAVVLPHHNHHHDHPHAYPDRLDSDNRLPAGPCCCGASIDFIFLLGDAWRIVRARPWPFVINAVITILMYIFLGDVVGGWLAGLLTLPLTASMMHAALQLARGGEAHRNTLTGSWFQSFLKPGLSLRVVGAYLVLNIPHLILYVVGVVMYFRSQHHRDNDDDSDHDDNDCDHHPKILFPLVLLAVVWQLLCIFVMPIVLDRPHLSVFRSICLSLHAANRNWGSLIGVVFYSVIVVMAGGMLLLVGTIPAVAVLIVSVTLMYAHLFGLYAVALPESVVTKI